MNMARILCLGLMLLTAGCSLNQNALGSLNPVTKARADTGAQAIALGREALRLGEFNAAKGHFISAINLGGMTAEALTGIGLAEEGQGHLHQAQRFFESALRLAPNSVMAHNNLGVVLFQRARYHEAKQAFQSAYALSSGSSEIAQHNLRLANLTVAEIDANEAGVLQSHRLQRIGTSEYQLTETTVTVAQDDGAEIRDAADQEADDLSEE
ncbi:MAG: tetratricopeptide repeat protein, partial [Pseudomonadota bacterium]